MKNITVTLITNKQNEIKRFIDAYYGLDSDISSTTFRLTLTYKTLLETLDLISTLIDNEEIYSIEVFVEADSIIKITPKNLELYIRYVINRYITKNRLIADFRVYKSSLKFCFFSSIH